jgi:pyruvate dehydrogenase E1 component
VSFAKDVRPPYDQPAVSPELLESLDAIQRRAAWIATRMIHHANYERANLDGSKIGGHQASSTSMVSILTALYCSYLQPGDRVAIKPQSSPAFHAIQYLLGQLPRDYLTTLRAFGGLQPYPSRTKDPDHVDFSTGSVGLGAVAPAFAALAHRYARTHFGSVTSNRFIAVIGDAELDEGNVWEAILDESLAGLENLLWIVDLNRQSLDRVVPGIRAARLKRLFAENGWQVLETKFGCKLQSLFNQTGGEWLRQRIDEMSNEEYQSLIRLPGEALRYRLTHLNGTENQDIARIIADIPDEELPQVLSNLGGHDMEELLNTLSQVDDEHPTILFAYTIKGWGLPIAGHPLNHAALLTQEQIDTLRDAYGISPDDEWPMFDLDTPPGRVCAEAANRLFPAEQPQPVVVDAASIPNELAIPTEGNVSTQDAFGRLMVRLADVEELRGRIVTTSPDVSVSTNLAGWINKTGVFSQVELHDYEESEAYRLLKWECSPSGQHIELGISEMNLFMMLAMLGLSAELCGQHLIPIGTVYDPFVCRGLDALIYGLYTNSKFIFAGTPSGVSLSPEGGSHQSTVTPSLGAELPHLRAYEPCFAREMEWILIDALRQCCDRQHGRSTYLRLSTKLVEQDLLAPALQRLGAERLRRQVLAGGYRLVDWRDTAEEDGFAAAATHTPPVVHIATAGVMVPEAVEAARYLRQEGVAVNVLNLVSQRQLFETWQAARREQVQDPFGPSGGPFDWLILPEERRAPIVTVLDGASHSLSWLGSIYGALVISLGVDTFGQTGTRADLYRHFRIDAEHIAEAAFSALDLVL